MLQKHAALGPAWVIPSKRGFLRPGARSCLINTVWGRGPKLRGGAPLNSLQRARGETPDGTNLEDRKVDEYTKPKAPEISGVPPPSGPQKFLGRFIDSGRWPAHRLRKLAQGLRARARALEERETGRRHGWLWSASCLAEGAPTSGAAREHHRCHFEATMRNSLGCGWASRLSQSSSWCLDSCGRADLSGS
jgi:hypothetical protein